MTIVAQHYQPRRPIVVGNHQRCIAAPLRATRHAVPLCTSTFSSLVGSFESRLVVGNCQTSRLAASRHPASQRNASHLNEYQTQQQPHSCGFWWACPADRDPQLRAALHLAPPLISASRTSTNYATQRRRPSGRVRWVSHQMPSRTAASRVLPLRNAAHLFTSQRIPAKRRLPSGNVRFAGTTNITHSDNTLRRASHRLSTHLNGRPSGRHPQAFITEGFGMPSLVSFRSIARCCTPQRTVTRHISTHLTTTRGDNNGI